jgi:DNA-binding NarL/FixJ family response regulator
LADDLIRVMTVDHQALFRAAARELIAATDGFEPVLEVASGEEALEWAAQKDPQLVLITSDESEAVPKEAQESGAVALLAKQHLSRAVLRGLWAIHGPVR